MHAPTQLLRLEGGKPALDEVEPRRIGGREMRMEPRVACEPTTYGRRFMRTVVIHDDVDVEMRGYLRVQRGQERPKLHRAVPSTDLPEHLAGLHFQGREERRRAVPFVIVGSAFGLARAHREQGRRPVQG